MFSRNHAVENCRRPSLSLLKRPACHWVAAEAASKPWSHTSLLRCITFSQLVRDHRRAGGLIRSPDPISPKSERIAQRVRCVAKHKIPLFGTIGPTARKFQEKTDHKRLKWSNYVYACGSGEVRTTYILGNGKRRKIVQINGGFL